MDYQYICMWDQSCCTLVALKVLHPGGEEYSDVSEDSEEYEFEEIGPSDEEEEEMVPSEDEEVEMVQVRNKKKWTKLRNMNQILSLLPTLSLSQKEFEEDMVQNENNSETPPTCSQPQNQEDALYQEVVQDQQEPQNHPNQ